MGALDLIIGLSLITAFALLVILLMGGPNLTCYRPHEKDEHEPD